MLTIYRRHLKSCKNKKRTHRACKCPIWVQGYLNSTYVRRSLDVRSWETAQGIVRDWEADIAFGKKETEPKGRTTVEEAVSGFLADLKVRDLSEPTIKKYKTLLERQLKPFAVQESVVFLDELNLERVRKFRAGWKDSSISAAKKLERLKAFFRFCTDSEWIEASPAAKLKPPRVTNKPTLPFSKEEIEKIMWACDLYADRPRGRRKAVRTMVLLLRYSGFRIRDAIMLRRDAIRDGKIFLHTQKTGTPVWLPLPEDVLKELDGVVGPHPDYFFYNGSVKPEHAVSVWERTFVRLFELAGLKDAHCHRFRDTFAVDLLLRGVSVQDVSILLGHSDPAITWKHYAPWVKERQAKLEETIRKIWT